MTEADLSGYLYNTYNSSNRSTTNETLPRPSCLPFFVRINGQWALPFVFLLAGRNVFVEWRKLKSLQESCSTGSCGLMMILHNKNVPDKFHYSLPAMNDKGVCVCVCTYIYQS